MKNIGASAGVFPAQGEKKVEEEEEYIEKKNEMYFCLDDNPTYHIFAEGIWRENATGEVIGGVDSYFRHILTGERCETVWDCFSGWSEQNEKSAEQWETLCKRIEDLPNIEAFICDEKRVAV